METSVVEVKIELFGYDLQRYVWRKKGAAFHEKNTLPAVKRGGRSIMLGTGNIARVEGRIDSTRSKHHTICRKAQVV